jgi:hypothetical protein
MEYFQLYHYTVQSSDWIKVILINITPKRFITKNRGRECFY